MNLDDHHSDTVWTRLGAFASTQDADPSGGQPKKEKGMDPVGPSGAFDLWDILHKRTNQALYRPAKIAETEVAEIQTKSGSTAYMLRNCRRDNYISLKEEGLFLWNLIDGNKTIKDLNLDYISEFGQVGMKVIDEFLDLLKRKGFLLDKPTPVYAILSARIKQKKLWTRFKQGISHITHSSISAGWIDQYFRWMHDKIGRAVFSKLSLSMLFLLAAADLALAFYFLIIKNESLVLLPRPGSHDVIAMMVIYYLSVFVHENAHGLTVKHYGRKVIRGGVLVMYGSPLPYVDTTDIWMKNNGPRIAVSFAGPCSNGVIGAVFLILAWIIPESIYENLFMHAGIVNSLIFVCNLMPIVESDGHYILQDWLERPNLRKDSLAFVGKGMWRKLVKLERWTKWDYVYLLYGIVGVLGLGYMIVTAFHLWEYTFSSIVKEVVVNPRMVLEIASVSINIALLGLLWKIRLQRKKINIEMAIGNYLSPQNGGSL